MEWLFITSKKTVKMQKEWLSQSKKEYWELYSGLDVLLRAIDRFFHIENLSISQTDLPSKNFYNELVAVRDVIFRVLAILEVVIPENRKNAYWFQKFTESKLLNDHTRDFFKEKLYSQDTPEKSIYLLYDLFINLKGIITDLLKSEGISYLSYMNIGQLVSREIRGNQLLNPFHKEINPEFDTIDNPLIKDIVRDLKAKDLRKSVSLLYIYLFRFLRFLRHVDITSKNSISLNSSLLILIMLRSEIGLFHMFIKKTAAVISDTDLKDLLTLISYQFSMETRRVYIQELKDIISKKAPQHFRGKIENSKGILKNLTEQSIVQISRFFDHNINGDDIFPSFVDKLVQSLKLREDIFTLHRFITLLEEQAAFPELGRDIFKAMQKFMLDFRSTTFSLLRYDDYDEFAVFFNDISRLKWAEQDKILEKTRGFKIFLETSLRNIANRSELKDISVDIDKVEATLKKYI